MRINIYDDNDNWLRWGQLVDEWIHNPPAIRPKTVGDLRALLDSRGITATIDGPDSREIHFYDFSDDASLPLPLYLPNAATHEHKHSLVPPAPGPYNLPLFYDIAFGGAKRAYLSQQEIEDFSLRRVGEYTVNECC